MNERAEITVRGLVQGVFFRASAREEAERLGLAGEVRNLPDGSVEAFAEGPRERIESFIAWCRRGPPSARVEEVQVRWSKATGGQRGFHVTR